MDKGIKNKNVLVIIFEIIVIALALGGFTYATQKLLNNRTLTVIQTGEYNLDYVGETDISINGLEPISDSLVKYDTKEGVVRVEFSVRGVKENGDAELIYDVMLSNVDIDCSLLNKYTKWNLYKNGKLISTGNMDPIFDGNVLGESMRLTDIQEDLKDYDEDYDNYVLLFWISESCDDLVTCKRVDQSAIVNSKMNMKVFIALYSGEKKKFDRIPNYDSSCANAPVLYSNMIPITYSNGEWIVADISNSNKNNLWYDYTNQKWANAVVVSNSENYSEVGTKINSNDILANVVWIPRYRYKLWNVLEDGHDSYDAYDNGVDIVFEHGINSVTDSKKENDTYITHPAFGSSLKGFWVSKYEISNDNGVYKVKANTDSYRKDTLDNYKTIINGLNYTYGLGSDVSTHMITNLEWGATAYLSHSKYGVCSSDGCDSIASNNTYKSGNNKQDTTTRNVYGVYDMAGASGEYATGIIETGTATGEVILANGSAWNGNHGLLSLRDYLIRGGIDRGMFYFGEIGMDSVEVSTRICLSGE